MKLNNQVGTFTNSKCLKSLKSSMQSFSPTINTKRFNKFEKWSSQLIYLKFDLNFQSKLEDLDDFKNPKIEHWVY